MGVAAALERPALARNSCAVWAGPTGHQQTLPNGRYPVPQIRATLRFGGFGDGCLYVRDCVQRCSLR